MCSTQDLLRNEVAEVGGRWKVVLYGSAVMFVDKLEREGQTNEWIGAWLVFQGVKTVDGSPDSSKSSRSPIGVERSRHC
jgi:hypothetical protein